MDFEANAKDGVAVDWPIRYRDVEPWYEHVERFIGVSGQSEGLEQLPDSAFLPPMEMNCVEKHFKQSLAEKFGRAMTIGRTAHLTAPLAHSPQRGTCQSRNLCIRGCPFGAYFSSNSSTLPAAEKTGNMTLRPNSVVYELIYDEKAGRASGVRVLDAETNEQFEFTARVIFLCASTFGSAHVLMNSTSSRFPNGFGNDSGELGCNIMDHHLQVGALAVVDGFDDQYYVGQRPNGIYVPRFVNIGKDKRSYLRGFGYQGGASRRNWTQLMSDPVLGEDLKQKAATPGPWSISLGGFGEILPYHHNRVTLNRDRKDKHGLPTLTFDAAIGANEQKMRADMASEAATMLEAAGYRNVRQFDRGYSMGLGIHEMGTVRMGRDPKTSMLNEWNQIHACKNVYVTDGSCMTSSACQNPSLTYMALTARAANHAVEELKRMNL
jgi:choline dehydrogenase-like flavoprotein